MKVCSKYKEEKPLTEFHKRKASPVPCSADKGSFPSSDVISSAPALQTPPTESLLLSRPNPGRLFSSML